MNLKTAFVIPTIIVSTLSLSATLSANEAHETMPAATQQMNTQASPVPNGQAMPGTMQGNGMQMMGGMAKGQNGMTDMMTMMKQKQAMMQKKQAMMQAHMQKMETHTANIEALLRELVALQKSK